MPGPTRPGEADNLGADVLRRFLDDVAAGRFSVPVGRRYRLDEIAQAHRDLEAKLIGGKGVVLT